MNQLSCLSSNWSSTVELVFGLATQLDSTATYPNSVKAGFQHCVDSCTLALRVHQDPQLRDHRRPRSHLHRSHPTASPFDSLIAVGSDFPKDSSHKS